MTRPTQRWCSVPRPLLTELIAEPTRGVELPGGLVPAPALPSETPGRFGDLSAAPIEQLVQLAGSVWVAEEFRADVDWKPVVDQVGGEQATEVMRGERQYAGGLSLANARRTAFREISSFLEIALIAIPPTGTTGGSHPSPPLSSSFTGSRRGSFSAADKGSVFTRRRQYRCTRSGCAVDQQVTSLPSLPKSSRRYSSDTRIVSVGV